MIINKKLITYFLLHILLVCIQANDCSTTDILKGCTTCINNATQALNISSNLFVCVQIPNCAVVDSLGSCVKCINGAVLQITTNASNQCIYSNLTGCKTITDGVCTECISSNYALNTASGSCLLMIYDYCWKADITGCTQCSD